MLQQVQSHPSKVQEINSTSLHSSQTAHTNPIKALSTVRQAESDEISKNRRWVEEEHVLYLLFLEQNRDKIKSKLIRRSNAFFKEMAVFIGSKNPSQCRSYHQKYQLKHKFPHRIIRQEREKINLALYSQILLKKNLKTMEKTGSNDGFTKEVKKQTIQTHSLGCQTEIQGISTIFLRPDVEQKDCFQQKIISQNYFPFIMNHPLLSLYYQLPYYNL